MSIRGQWPVRAFLDMDIELAGVESKLVFPKNKDNIKFLDGRALKSIRYGFLIGLWLSMYRKGTVVSHRFF